MVGNLEISGQGTTGGGGTPGGSDTQVQFNDGGALGGTPGFTWMGSSFFSQSRLGLEYTTTSSRPVAFSILTESDDAFNYAIYARATTPAVDTTNRSSLIGFYASAVANTASGFTVSSAAGGNFSAELADDGTVTHLDGVTAQVDNYSAGHVGTGSAVRASVYSSTNGATYDTLATVYALLAADSSAITVTNLYGYWVGNYDGTSVSTRGATNVYSFWDDLSDGVFRIKKDSTFNSVSQSIPALYNPQITKYTPGAANYERIVQQWNSNIAEIGTEAGGTGTLRVVKFIGASLNYNNLFLVASDGSVTAPNYTVSGSAFRTDTTSGHQGFFQAYDNDNSTYRTFATLTNGNTPSFALAAPAGGTLTGDFSTLAVGGVSVTTTASTLAVFAATTSAQLAGVLSDETGFSSGAKAVFSIAPALTGPVVLTEAVGSSALTLTGATQTASFPVIDAAQTWNNSGVTFTGWKLNITNTASAAASRIVDFQLGGSSLVYIRRDGSINVINSASGLGVNSIFDSGLNASWANSSTFATVVRGMNAPNVLVIGGAVGAFADASNVWGQRNTTNAQAFRLYNTFTSSTSYERFELDWQTTANVLLFGAQKGSGGGTARVASWVYGGTSTPAISVPITSGAVTLGGGLTLAVAGPLSMTSGTNQRAGNATLVGGTVTVNNTTVTANTVVMLTRKTSGGTIGTAITYTLSAGASFTITSDNILDTSVFSYVLIEVP